MANSNLLEYEGEPTRPAVWANSPEQRAFREEVLKAHLARSRRRKGLPEPDLSGYQFAPVRGTSVVMRTDAAEAANRLFQAARDDLAKARAEGHPDALRTMDLTSSSGYRGSAHQRHLWCGYFKNYYNRTRKGRSIVPEGSHSAKAVSYMLDVFGLPNRIAAPGYSNHQRGIAIDFQQLRTKGHEISNSYDPQQQKKWHDTWFFGWLQDNAARFGFKPYAKEAWHWEYRPANVSTRIATEGGHAQEFEFESSERSRTRPFLGGFVHTFTCRSLPVTVSVFCPKSVKSRQAVQVLLYAHGLLYPCPPVPKRLPEGFITAQPFRLGEIVDASNRETILVVPLFVWKSGQKHELGQPRNLNKLLNEVMAELGTLQGTSPPSISALILAGHSRAYDFLEPLAHSHADPEMQQGPLAQLTQVWAFDTSYVCDPNAWTSWLSAKPHLQVDVFFRKTVPGKSSGTSVCGWRMYSKMKGSGGRLRVIPIDPVEKHCDVPTRRLPALLSASSRFSR